MVKRHFRISRCGPSRGRGRSIAGALDKNPESEVRSTVMRKCPQPRSAGTMRHTAYRRILSKNPRHECAAIGAVRLIAHLMDADTAFRVIRAYGPTSNAESLDPQAFVLDTSLAIGEVHEHFTSLPHRSAVRRVMVDSLHAFLINPAFNFTQASFTMLGDGMCC